MENTVQNRLERIWRVRSQLAGILEAEKCSVSEGLSILNCLLVESARQYDVTKPELLERVSAAYDSFPAKAKEDRLGADA